MAMKDIAGTASRPPRLLMGPPVPALTVSITVGPPVIIYPWVIAGMALGNPRVDLAIGGCLSVKHRALKRPKVHMIEVNGRAIIVQDHSPMDTSSTLPVWSQLRVRELAEYENAPHSIAMSTSSLDGDTLTDNIPEKPEEDHLHNSMLGSPFVASEERQIYSLPSGGTGDSAADMATSEPEDTSWHYTTFQTSQEVIDQAMDSPGSASIYNTHDEVHGSPKSVTRYVERPHDDIRNMPFSRQISSPPTSSLLERKKHDPPVEYLVGNTLSHVQQTTPHQQVSGSRSTEDAIRNAMNAAIRANVNTRTEPDVPLVIEEGQRMARLAEMPTDTQLRAAQLVRGQQLCGPYCQTRVRTVQALCEHMDDQHGAGYRIFKCPHLSCEWAVAGFHHSAEARRHVRTRHSRPQYLCPVESCGKPFGRADSFMRHYHTHWRT